MPVLPPKKVVEVDSYKFFAGLGSLGAIDFDAYATATASTLPQTDPNTSLFAYITSGRGLTQDVLQGVGMKGDRLAEFVQKMATTQADLDLLYNRIQTYKKYPDVARNVLAINVPSLEAFHQDGYIKFQKVLFWAQMVPYIHDALKKAGVRAADYVTAVENDTLIRAFSYWAGVDDNYQTYRDNGQLRGLGFQVSIPVLVAIAVVSIAVVYAAMNAWTDLMATWRATEDQKLKGPLIDCVQKGGANASACQATLTDLGVQEQKREDAIKQSKPDPLAGITGLLMAGGAIALGVIFLPTLLEGAKSGAAAIRARRESTAVAGLYGRRRYRRRR